MRTQRLKQAKDEAEREAAHYRSQMENDYQKNVLEVLILLHISHFVEFGFSAGRCTLSRVIGEPRSLINSPDFKFFFLSEMF